MTNAVETQKVKAVQEPGHANVWAIQDSTGSTVARMTVNGDAEAWAKRIENALNGQGSVPDADLLDWAQRHDIHGSLTTLRAIVGDAQTLNLACVEPVVVAAKIAKTDPQQCPGCDSSADYRRSGAKWKLLCSTNKGLNSSCKKEGHWMFSRKDAVRVWNEVK